MLRKQEVGMPVLALMLIALGGLLLHTRIHPTTSGVNNWVPLIAGLVSVVVVPILFLSSRTVVAGYLLNLATVVAGIVMMALFSIEHWEGPVTLNTVLLKSTLPDILVLLAKLPIAQAILNYYRPKPAP